jgi:Tfp pilus assembly protein PilV
MKSSDHRPRRRSGQTGVTLIETLVALGLFATTVVGIGRFLVFQVRTASENHLTSNAYTIAEEHLEGLRALEYADMAGGTTTKTLGGTQFTLVSTVATDTPAPNMKQITVNVSWKSPEGPKNVSLQTIYTGVRR